MVWVGEIEGKEKGGGQRLIYCSISTLRCNKFITVTSTASSGFANVTLSFSLRKLDLSCALQSGTNKYLVLKL